MYNLWRGGLTTSTPAINLPPVPQPQSDGASPSSRQNNGLRYATLRCWSHYTLITAKKKTLPLTRAFPVPVFQPGPRGVLSPSVLLGCGSGLYAVRARGGGVSLLLPAVHELLQGHLREQLLQAPRVLRLPPQLCRWCVTHNNNIKRSWSQLPHIIVIRLQMCMVDTSVSRSAWPGPCSCAASVGLKPPPPYLTLYTLFCVLDSQASMA